MIEKFIALYVALAVVGIAAVVVMNLINRLM